MKRRTAIKNLSILPVAGVAVGSILPLESVLAAPVAPPAPKRDFIKELGLRTFINAAGTYTAMTASLMPSEVMEAINMASKKFVMYGDVQDKVGAKIAEICHAEAAMVTAGCWSALVLGTAGVLTGTDRKKLPLLPNLETMKSEVIVQNAHNSGYVHALTNTGVKIIPVETAQDVEKAFNEKTAMMWFLNAAALQGKISDKEWVALGRKLNVPTMIDIAADVPPVENLWKYNEMGFDLVCLSGGKGIRGPQSAGVLMGRKDLIAAARLNAPPNGGNIGRGMKVNKEEILGMYAALDRYVNTDHAAEWKMWENRVSVIVNSVKSIEGVKTEVTVPPIANHTPTLNIFWDNTKVKITRREIQEKLRNGNPSIEVMGGNNDGINITVFMLNPGEEKIVAKRLREELSEAAG